MCKTTTNGRSTFTINTHTDTTHGLIAAAQKQKKAASG